MKIAFDHQIFCAQRYGGISRYFKHLAEHLLLQGECANIFVPFHRNYYLKSVSSELVKGRKVERYPWKTGRAFSIMNSMLARSAIRKFRPDVVHETYYSAGGVAPEHCPTVLTVYDMIHELYPSSFPAKDSTVKIKRAAVNRADHVICISENTRQDLLSIVGVPREKTSVVHLGFDRFVVENEVSNLPTFAKSFLLFVGSRRGYKNFSAVLNVFSRAPMLQADFDLVAFGGGQFSRDELQKMKELGFAEDQVRQISGDDSVLARLYDQASALIYPSIYEGFGLPPLEAMAHRCPVVSSNSSSMPEVCGRAAEYFDPKSSDELRVALENVLYSGHRANELVALGEERLKHFSWEKCASDTLNVYQKVRACQVK